MDVLFGLSFFVFDALGAVLLVACWQHTRIAGFLWLAASYVLGIAWRWLVPWVYAMGDPAGAGGLLPVHAIAQGTYLGLAAVGLFGLWGIYRGLKARAAAPAG